MDEMDVKTGPNQPGYCPGQSTAVCAFNHHGGIRAEFGEPYTIAFQVKTRLTSTTIQTTAVCTFNHHGGIRAEFGEAASIAFVAGELGEFSENGFLPPGYPNTRYVIWRTWNNRLCGRRMRGILENGFLPPGYPNTRYVPILQLLHYCKCYNNDYALLYKCLLNIFYYFYLFI